MLIIKGRVSFSLNKKTIKNHIINTFIIKVRLFLMIFIGGGAGSILRYLINFWCTDINQKLHYPVGTFIANILGCFLIGLFSALFVKYNPSNTELKSMLTVGLCGGFTTFSTFSNECLGMLRSGNYITFALYIAVSITLGMIAAFAGQSIIK